MKVTVVIPTYNEERFIDECLKSLSKQTQKNLEVIVVDDGSNDKTVSVLSNFQFSNINFQILKQKHKGPGEARNLGASKAKGKILVFVDADMTFDKDFVKNLVKPILDGKSKGTFSKEEYVSNWENVWARCWNINEGWTDKKRHAEDYPDTQKVFRAILKSEFDRVGGFDRGGHYTDDCLSERLGYEATNVKTAKFYHANPDNLGEVFSQAKWAAKRKYKCGLLGVVVALIRTSLPFSLIIGIVESVANSQPRFLLFKITYDFGALTGIHEHYLFRNSLK